MRSLMVHFAPLTAALWLSCGATDTECRSFDPGGGESGETGHELPGGEVCAPECILFCGTKEECSRSMGGAGGVAENGGGAPSDR